MAAFLAAGSSALLLMAADQGAAALAEAVRVRGRIGGGLPWYQEFERYALLLTPGDVQGAIGRRAAVLATLLAVVGLAWILAGRRRSGIAAGPARRLLVTLGLSAVALMVSPTKWTQHFGALTGLGTAALTLGLVVFGRRALAAVRDAETARLRQVAGLAAATVVCGLVLAGQNMWPFVSGWYTPTFSTVPPLVGTVPIATIVLVLGGVVVVHCWCGRCGGGARRPRRTHPPARDRNAETAYQNAELLRFCTRRVPAPAAPVAVVLVAVLALQVLGLARVAVAHADGYTPASDVLATLRGDPCGLQSALPVETDPAAGVLPVAPPPTPVPGTCPPPPFLRPRPSTSTRAGPRCPASPWPAPARRPGTPSIPGSATACCRSSSP